MSKLLRYYEPGQCVFITSVTANRQPLLAQYADILKRAVRNAAKKSRFSIVAWVILPDHFHAIIDCPDGDTPKIVQKVKLAFSVPWRRLSGCCGRVWQSRYWDHIIRTDEDMKRHIEYIHYNPVKHGFVLSPRLWPHSSFHKYLQTGRYDSDWGEKRVTFGDDEFGE